MEIIVKKPTQEEKEFFNMQPTWGCEVSTFDWFYDAEESCILLEGEVTVTYGANQSVTFGAGDHVTFPKGLQCVWHVKKAVKKHYVFR